jgi:hypothetical protein
MRIPLRSALVRRLRRVMERKPDKVIIPDGHKVSMRRWHLIPRNPIFNVFLHHIVESDDDRALHDHPWISLSVILDGSYVEITRAGARLWPTGAIIFRRAEHAHRLVIKEHGLSPYGAVTLFITGPVIRQWGFLCPQGWRSAKEYTVLDHGRSVIGRGCD